MLAEQAALYLIPSTLGNEDPEYFLPAGTLAIVRKLKHFIVENEKTARAFLKTCKIEHTQAELNIFELDKHDSGQELKTALDAISRGESIGLLSEAGCPAVADPGSKVVALAHQHNMIVRPLVGPSSLLLALMASGLEGQRFTFHGYLPVDRDGRVKALQKLEKDAQMQKSTQLFIETPYRNNSMLKDILSSCFPETRLCLAVSLNTSEEKITTLPIREWKKRNPDLHKQPCVFLLR
ncbi:SAM-dependent methyltransferase [soil metagenome]